MVEERMTFGGFRERHRDPVEPHGLLLVLLTYNSKIEWLVEAMHSVKVQTYDDWQGIVADSSDNDRVRQAVHEFSCDRIKYVRYEHQKTADVAFKVNKVVEDFGIDRKFVVVMSDDDMLSPGFMKKQVKAIEGDDSLAFAQGFNVIFGKENALWTPEAGKGTVDQIANNQFAGTCVMRMDLFRKFGGYDKDAVPEGHPTGLEDFNLFVHYLKNGFGYALVKEPLLFCRTHDAQNNRKIYGTDLYWDILQNVICKKQGIKFVRDNKTKKTQVTYDQVSLSKMA